MGMRTKKEIRPGPSPEGLDHGIAGMVALFGARSILATIARDGEVASCNDKEVARSLGVFDMKTNRRDPDGKGRLVYSTNLGRVCPGCGCPTHDCKCSQQANDEPIPGRIVAKLRLEKNGR